ncbi:bifunctional hydroxymethylpyrimidine kinase/phosphomethylpyrimidine kinase [Desulfatirhabdium butyrativorans]|uniref:bifunctional hydroxymethylpyrimidine kinase/phosphomethylpyrimidine kinase n=1 Tax=Desulfatirhabdium butyrativorans TaxID=340467 RepID=UPI0004266109|nr:bifunctional hydroxymethylpyrimidine kinase/phosphomethylpyrimidine kinase [Desulfatirhabdium butyrativorans]
MNPVRLLTIAGSDSGGGAGIQADLKTFCSLGCYGMSVICALTAQNTMGVKGIFPVPESFVSDQIDAVLEDIGADAVKIGMLHEPAIVQTVVDRLRFFGVSRIVADPVMVSETGSRLLQPEAIDALQRLLFPLAAVITPNRFEAAVLLGMDAHQLIDAGPSHLRGACIALAKSGAGGVLLKGGHAANTETASDLLYIPAEDRFACFDTPRIATRNTHGTGCTLSSAIAAFLGMGFPLVEAVAKAKAFVQQAIEAAADLRIGKGSGPLAHCALENPM